MSLNNYLRNHFRRWIAWCHGLEAAPKCYALCAVSMNIPSAKVDYCKCDDVPFIFNSISDRRLGNNSASVILDLHTYSTVS